MPGKAATGRGRPARQHGVSFPYPVLLCDIGGTNVRLAVTSKAGGAPKTLAHVATHEHPGLAEAIRASLGSSIDAQSLIVCAAGPIDSRSIKLTNANWTIDGPSVARRLRLKQGLLLNDFEAQAIMLPALRMRDTQAIGMRARSRQQGRHLVLGPGTGLGAALLVPQADRLLPLTTEAGHMDFTPASDFEAEVWDALRRELPRVTGESLLSGPGTIRVHRALCAVEGTSAPIDDPQLLTESAKRKPGGPEARTLRFFWHLMGRFAGNLALGVLARDGVTLSGGVLPKIVDFLDPAAFRRAFEHQTPLQSVVARIPTRLVTTTDTVQRGLSALAAEPQRFAIDYDTRLWV